MLSVALAGAQNLTGRWTGNFSTADNGLEIVVALNQAADGTITGYILSPRSTDTITSGKADGNNSPSTPNAPAAAARFRS